MSNLARKLSTILQFLKRKFQRKPKVRRSELIQAMRGGAFRRLEPRRVLSVNATLNAGVLDINILSDDADTTASLQSASATEFFVDANNNNAHDATELRALFTDLQQINVVGDGGNTAFFWRDNFSTALLNAANANNHVVSVSNVNSFESSATATIDGNASLSAVQSLKLDGDLSIAGKLNASASNVVGTIETSANGVLNVDGAAQLSARTVNLNGTVGNNSFDDLTITSAEDTTVAGAIAADRFSITANGAVEIQNAAVIEANAVEIVTQSSNADIQIDGTIRTLGNIEIDSQDSIQLGSGARLVVTGAGDLLLTANSDSVDSDGSDGIELANGSSLSANTGAIRLTALGAGAGDVQVSSLVTNSSAVNAIEINAAANIIDNTTDEASNLAAINGTIALNSLLGSIGEADDIDIDATNLIFNATGTNGVVNVSDLANGLTISGASQATGGGSITTHSPLTISANVNVGAAMVFTAGNSAAAGDSITIDNNAVVTLDSVTASTLTFNAGDDIVFDSGRVITQNGVHSVVLAADLDHAGVGAADGDRGAISQNGLAGIEVATNNLTATSASGIDLDTAVDSLVATTSDVGNIFIDEQNAITLTNVATTNGSITVNAGGLITATSINAAGISGSVALTSTAGGVDVASINAASNVELTATGNVSSGVVQATNGFVKLTSTTGDALIGSITGSTTVDITATLGSINDATDDQLVDITAGGLITLKSANEIAGAGADDRLELAEGSNVAATSSTAGDVLLRGVGGLTLTNLSTQAGSIDVVAAGLIVTATVTANGAGSNASLFTSAGGISSTQVKAANNATLRATSGNVDCGSVEATAGAVTLTADSGNVIVGQTIAGTTVAVTASGLNSDVTLTNQVRSTGNLTLTAADSVRFNASAAISVTGAGDVTITANSDALDGDDADELSMQDGSTLSATTGKIQLNSSGASGGNVTLGSVSTSSLAADAVVVRAGANIVDGTGAENANILATGGTIDLIALQGSIGGTDDIDIDATNLVFNAAPTAIGVVNITDLAGGVRISGTSQAGGGGSMTANSPLTISANVNVGGSMVFTAAIALRLAIRSRSITTRSSRSIPQPHRY